MDVREENTPKTPFRILRPESHNSALKELQEHLNESGETLMSERQYKASELGLNRRVLSHWRSLGLIHLKEKDPSKVSRLSYLEVFWVQTAIELRSFGMSLEDIFTVKETLYLNHDKPLLEYYLARMAFSKSDVFMVVARDGRADIGSRSEIDISEALGALQGSYIKLNMRNIANQFQTYKEEIVQEKDFWRRFDPKEIELVDDIREGKYKEINIKFNNGVVTHISRKNVSSGDDAVNQLKELMSQGEYATVEVILQKGKPIYFSNSVMEKT